MTDPSQPSYRRKNWTCSEVQQLAHVARTLLSPIRFCCGCCREQSGQLPGETFLEAQRSKKTRMPGTRKTTGWAWCRRQARHVHWILNHQPFRPAGPTWDTDADTLCIQRLSSDVKTSSWPCQLTSKAIPRLKFRPQL